MRRPTAEEVARWRALGRFLPRDVRERIYEPAFSDLLYDRLTRTVRQGGQLPFGVQAIGTILGCVPIVVPHIFVRDGGLTRVGRLTLTVVGVLLVALMLVRQLTRSEPGY